MFDSIISSFTQAIKKNGYNVAIFMLIAFLVWQVTNHLPTQVNDVKQDINRLEDRMDKRMDRLENRMDRLEDKIDKLIFHFMGDKAKK